MACHYNPRSAVIFSLLLHNERGQEVHENYINDISEKINVWAKWTILDLKIAHPYNCGSIVTIFLKFAQSGLHCAPKTLVKKRAPEINSHICFTKIL